MVLIKDMMLPFSCDRCRLKDRHYGECKVKWKKISDYEERRPRWCPLEEYKEK